MGYCGYHDALDEAQAEVEGAAEATRPFSHLHVVFTGTMTIRSLQGWREAVEALGGTVSATVSKSVNLVVAGDNAGTKLEKANELEIKVYSETQFYSFCVNTPEFTRFRSADAEAQALPKRVMHLERRSLYEVLGTGKMQSKDWVVPHTYRDMGETETDMVSVDMKDVVVYRSEDDNTLWVRPEKEFQDGRFEAVDPAPSVAPFPEEIGDRGRQHLTDMIARMDASERVLTEKECFLLEAATQYGFEFIDDNIDVLAVTTESFVDFIKMIQESRQSLEPFKVNEFIDDKIKEAAVAVFNRHGYVSAVGVAEAADIAREAALRVIFDKVTLINNLANHCHGASAMAGWWTNMRTGEDLRGKRNKGELLMLMVSEAAEIMEAVRKNLPSEHLPGFTGEEEEAADLLIRLGDYAGAHKLRLGEAVVAKMAYNATREDHKIENRLKADGKQF